MVNLINLKIMWLKKLGMVMSWSLPDKLGRILKSNENNLKFDQKYWISISNLRSNIEFDKIRLSNLTKIGRFWSNFPSSSSKWVKMASFKQKTSLAWKRSKLSWKGQIWSTLILKFEFHLIRQSNLVFVIWTNK